MAGEFSIGQTGENMMDTLGTINKMVLPFSPTRTVRSNMENGNQEFFKDG
jgi:hypothetical protein